MSFKILLATDGSQFSNKAADFGIDLAKKLDAEVLALYVLNLKHFELYALEHHDDITGYEDENLRLGKESKEALDHVVEQAGKLGVNLVTRTVRGYPADDIMKIAKDESFDMIVIGNLGK